MPLSHLTLTVSHLPTSTSFFLSCLQPLGYKFIGRHDDYIGFGQDSNEPADFWITEQKPGCPAGAAHVAFPAPSKDAVNSFFICALKAGGKLHGEPKTRDSQSGYFSAAVMDMDGNSIEAVYRPDTDMRSNSGSTVSGSTVARSAVSKPALALLENGSVVSKASSVKSNAKSHVSRALTAVDRPAPSERVPSERGGSVVSSREIQQAPPQTYVVHTHTTQKSDDSKAAKTIVGTLIGAAAGAAIAYAMSKGDSEQSPATSSLSPSQFMPQEFRQLSSHEPSPAQSQFQDYQGYRAIEAPPPRSVYSTAESRPALTRSVTSKNPWASTVYEGTEFGTRGPKGSVYYDEGGRRASEGSIYNQSEMPLRAIEYPPASESQQYPADVSTLISSFREKSRISEKGSVYSTSTIKASKSHHSHTQSSHHSISKSHTGSTASSTRTARQIPLPEGSTVSYSSYRSATKSTPAYDDVDVETHVTPDDSISQVGDSSRRSSYSHRSHHSHKSHASKRSSKFDEPVRPSDSVSQVSSHASRRTAKAGGSVAGGGSIAGSKISSSRRASQVA
ncbi:VOC family protein [Aspergillus foveolatus]|uniref:VOC family protein n=1 Tax=Aspergillus foveolatus TaxID=210207 RepID=UPI003CCE2E0E